MRLRRGALWKLTGAPGWCGVPLQRNGQVFADWKPGKTLYVHAETEVGVRALLAARHRGIVLERWP